MERFQVVDGVGAVTFQIPFEQPQDNVIGCEIHQRESMLFDWCHLLA